MLLPPTITSSANARVKALRASLSGKASKPGDLLGLEGEHLIEEAHRAGYSFETVYLREGSDAPREPSAFLDTLRARDWAVLSRDVFEGAVSTQSPQGIAATWRIHEPDSPAEITNTLVLEQLQDPGNFGTLIRSAEAFGMSRVMVTPGTANQWNPKVVRAGAGSVLRVPVLRRPIQEIAAQLKGEGVRLFAAVPHVTNEPASSLSYDTDFERPYAIVIGNESVGLSDGALSLADEQVRIPCAGPESLNAAVAGSILMYEAMRQMTLRSLEHRRGTRI